MFLLEQRWSIKNKTSIFAFCIYCHIRLFSWLDADLGEPLQLRVAIRIVKFWRVMMRFVSFLVWAWGVSRLEWDIGGVLGVLGVVRLGGG